MRIISQFKYYNCVYPSSSDDPPTLEIRDYCEKCHHAIKQTDEYITDENELKFCSDKCFKEFYGYQEKTME